MAVETILPDLGTEILIPVCAVVGIAFALVQWLIVSKVKLVPEVPNSAEGKCFTDSLLEEEEGINERSIVHKCAEIQAAISEGMFLRACV